MFYNLGFAGRAMRKIGAIEFATTIAPGLRDVLLTGKIKECVDPHRSKPGKRVYDEVVVDAPPTGRIGSFLDVTKAMADLAKGGPVHSQSEGVVRLLHSPETVVHLVALLEALPVQETADAVAELARDDLHLGAVIVNRANPTFLPRDDSAGAAAGDIDAASIRSTLTDVGITLSDDDFAGLLTETIEHASMLEAQEDSAEKLARARRRPAAPCPRSPTASTSAGCTSWPNTSRNRACDDRNHRIVPTSAVPDRPRRAPASTCRRSSPTRRRASWCVAAPAASARPRRPRPWRCGRPSRADAWSCSPSIRRGGSRRRSVSRELDNTPQPVKLGPEADGRTARDDAEHAAHVRRDGARAFDAREGPADPGNPFYQTVASSFSGTQEYMAMEKLGQLASSDKWDLVIVDTPPSRNALDFLDAPQRLGSFLDGRMIRLLSAPGRGLDQARHRRDGPRAEGCLDHRRKPNAFRRIGVRSVARFDVRWVPRACHANVRVAAPGRAPISW